MKVLGLDVTLEPEGEEGASPFRGAESFAGAGPTGFSYPVVRVEVRVGVDEPVGWGEPSEEDARRAAELLLGVERPPRNPTAPGSAA